MSSVITDPARGLLQSAIDASGEERWDALSVLADFCEERGDPVAAGWREIVWRRKWPEKAVTVWWFNEEFVDWHYDYQPLSHWLPRAVFRRLRIQERKRDRTCDYDNEADALLDAAQAFAAEAHKTRSQS